MNHKKKAIYLGLLLTISLIFINTSCKNFGVPDYQFTVTLGEGVSGTPAAGTYSYKELSVVTYNHALSNEEVI